MHRATPRIRHDVCTPAYLVAIASRVSLNGRGNWNSYGTDHWLSDDDPFTIVIKKIDRDVELERVISAKM